MNAIHIFMKHQLDVFDRVLLVNMVLPKEGSYIKMRKIESFKNELQLSVDEIRIWGVEDRPGGGLVLGVGVTLESTVRDFEIDLDMTKIIKESLMDMDKREKLPKECVDLYEEFVVNADKVA